MFRIFSLAKPACMVVLFAMLTACSQTGTSSYGGGFGFSAATTTEQRQAKIFAARKRAGTTAIAKRKAFIKKRQDHRLKRAGLKTPAVKSAKNRASKRRIKKRRATKAKLARYKIKRTKKAFIGKKSRAIGRLKINASWKCVPSRLKKVIAQVRRRYGAVTINSTYRSRRRNRRAGGKKKSYHLHCRAVDFRVRGRTRGLTRFLARHPLVGGWKRYPSGFYHIDTGPKRTW